MMLTPKAPLVGMFLRMPFHAERLTLLCRRLFFCAFVALASLSIARAQQKPAAPQATPEPAADDVVRVSTELVQTDVMVFDRSGKFVDNLRPEQFELRVDGKPQAVSFFERVAAGSVNEEAQLAAARGRARTEVGKESTAPVKPLDRGRLIIFFVDDFHLAADSIYRTRKMIDSFIDKEMGQNDLVGVMSASGQVGFLQQLTDNKTVLHAAVSKLNLRQMTAKSFERPIMSEFQALQIEQNNPDAVSYFVDATIREMGMDPRRDRDIAENMVRQRARVMLQQSGAISVNTLSALRNLVRSSAQLPGRKLLFFISEGFLLESRISNVQDVLQRVTDAAARAGVVIYTMDARGLVTGMPDASSESSPDTTGRLTRASAGEIFSNDDALNALAADTGGRAIRNTNALDVALTKVIKETEVYYLLAWRPEQQENRGGKFRRLEVSIKGRPDLTVRVRRGFLEEAAAHPSAAKSSTTAAKANTAAGTAPKFSETELRNALSALYPKNGLPVAVTNSITDSAKEGITLAAWMQIESDALTFAEVEGKQSATFDIAGAVINEQGKPVGSFQERLEVKANGASKRQHIIYNFQTHLTPGLYQLRVAAHDVRSGRTGSAMQWIEAPDLAKGQYGMSGLLLGIRKSNAPAENGSGKDSADPATSSVGLSVDHRYTRNSFLRFLTYIYNAARGPQNSPPDVALQVQIFRDDQPVLTDPLHHATTEGVDDLSRLPYAAEIRLESLPPGRYVLQVTAIDRIAKKSAMQRTHFEIE